MRNFEGLTALPGADREWDWLEERLEALSERAHTIFASALARQPPGRYGL